MPSNCDVLQGKVSCLLPHGAGANPWNFYLNFPDASAALWLESLIRWGISVFVTIFLTAEGVPSLCPQICSLERVRTLWWGCSSPWLTKGRNLQKGFNSTESHSSMAVLPRVFFKSNREMKCRSDCWFPDGNTALMSDLPLSYTSHFKWKLVLCSHVSWISIFSVAILGCSF